MKLERKKLHTVEELRAALAKGYKVYPVYKDAGMHTIWNIDYIEVVQPNSRIFTASYNEDNTVDRGELPSYYLLMLIMDVDYWEIQVPAERQVFVCIVSNKGKANRLFTMSYDISESNTEEDIIKRFKNYDGWTLQGYKIVTVEANYEEDEDEN